MALKQSEDPVIANAKYQLAAQKLMIDGPLKNQSNLRIVGDRLYRGCQFVVPESMREPILSSDHKRSDAGISRIFSEISKRYYWPSMWKDIRNHCGSCLTCLRNKRAYKMKEPQVPVKIQASRPRSVVAFDLAVLPWSSQGYRYTLVVVDLFSKFLEAWPLKEKDTTSVIDDI